MRRSISVWKLGENGHGRTSNQACKEPENRMYMWGSSLLENRQPVKVDQGVSSSALWMVWYQMSWCQEKTVFLQKNEYYLYGQFVAMALLQGSPGSQVFWRVVTEYILFGDLNQVHPSGSEVPDYEVRKKLEKLEAITNSEMFAQKASFNFPERFSPEYYK